MTYRAPNALRGRSAAKRWQDIFVGVKAVVVGYLFYLVLLRSSKVGMWLEFRHQSVELGKVYEFFKDARPYFEVARQGVFVNLALGLLWCFICFLIGVLVEPFVGDRAYDATQHLFNCARRMLTAPDAAIRRVADLLEVDNERVRLWMFARAAAEPRDTWNDASMTLAKALS